MPASVRRQTIIDTLFLLVALATYFFVTTRSALVMDEDIWWHLRAGHWMLDHRAVPVKDMFSAHTMGQPWIAYTWLFDVLVSWIFDSWGYRGMLAFTTTIAAAYTSCLIVFLARFMNLRRAMILAFLAWIALMPLKWPRPWLFTILFFAIELALLWIARERDRPVWLLPIVPLFALWANIHIQFVYGLALLGLFAIEASLPARFGGKPWGKPRARRLWILLAASIAATLLNPYGWNLYRVVFQYATQSAPLLYVQEMQSLPFRIPSHWVFLLLICAAIFVLGAAREKSVLLISLLAAAGYCGFRSQRDIWFPVTVALLALSSEMRKRTPAFARSRCIYAVAIPGGILLTLGLLTIDPRFSDVAMSKAVAEHFPEDACEYIERAHLTGPLFNSYNWGGYLIWRLPNMPVSIDGRANLYEQYLPTAVNTIRGQSNWSLDPDLRKARTIVLDHDGPLTSILRVNPRFRLLYEDSTASVFEPVW